MVEHRESERHIQKTIELSKKAFYKGLESKESTWIEFFIGQVRFMRKRWWVIQFLVLFLLWGVMYYRNSEEIFIREAATLMPMFGMLIIPELWKNMQNNSIEIENAACFTMRQIYAARLTMFAFLDLFLLTIFFWVTTFTFHLTLLDIIVQFIIPLNVTACIFLGVLCWGHFRSEYVAIGFCIMWVGIWHLIIGNERLYNSISGIMWIGLMILTFIGMFFAGRYLLKTNQEYSEEPLLWN